MNFPVIRDTRRLVCIGLLWFFLAPRTAGAEAIVQSSDAKTAQPAAPQEPSLSTAIVASVVHSGWFSLNASLVLYDPLGNLAQEIGLGTWDEDGQGRDKRRHIVRGGASRNGHFAWSWEKTMIFAPGKEEAALEQSKNLHFWGMDGLELWHDEKANALSGVDPAILSPTGEHILVVEGDMHSGEAVLYDYLGNRLFEARGTGPAEFLTISPGGKFALVRWHELDQPPTYTLLDNHNRISRTLPTNKIMAGDLTIDDSGKIYAGRMLTFDAAASTTTVSAPASPPPAKTQP